MNTNIVFMGSPDFAVPSLEELAKGYKVVGVITQPDRPFGRGQKLAPSAVKAVAETLDLPVFQPERMRSPEALAQLKAWQPDLVVVAAYGQILSAEVLAVPTKGCLNVHASLLPRWRGASPIQAAIEAGDATTGVTIMEMAQKLDAGPIVAQREVPIRDATFADELSQQLAFLGARTLVEILPAYLEGGLKAVPQDESLVTYAPMLKKNQSRLNFNETAEQLMRKVHAYHPWPGTSFEHKGLHIKVLDAHVHHTFNTEPGLKYVVNGLPAIGTSDCLLVLDKLQPAGKKPMTGEEFLRGQRDWLEPDEVGLTKN